MALPNSVRRLSEVEYLEIERAADFKSEFFEGEMFAMAGGTRAHSLISANFIGELRSAFRDGTCIVFDSSLRVKVELTGLETYPDVIIASEPQRFLDGQKDTLLNPTGLIEVLSDSTEAYDRGKKFEHYRQIPSLREYILASQHDARVEQFIRQDNGWLLCEIAGLSNRLTLECAQATILLAEIYAKVEFEPTSIRSLAQPKG